MNFNAVTLVASWFALAAQPTLAHDWSIAIDVSAPTPYVAQPLTSFAPDYIAGDEGATSTELPKIAPDQGPIDRAKAVRTELLSFKDYGYNWDDNDASVPMHSDIDDALAFLDLIPADLPVPKAMIGSSGTIGLYWDRAKIFADIAMDGQGTFSLFTRDKGTKIETYADGLSIADLDNSWFSDSLKDLRNA